MNTLSRTSRPRTFCLRLGLAVAALGLAIVPGCDKGQRDVESPDHTVTSPKGHVTFGARPSKPGDKFRGSFTATVDVMPAIDGFPSKKTHENRIYTSEYLLKVTGTKGTAIDTVQIKYTGGREAILAYTELEDEAHQLLGDVYSASNGSYDGPSAGQSYVDRVLDRDVRWYGSPGSLQSQLRGKSLGVGDSFDVTPGEIWNWFDGEGGSMLNLRFDGLSRRCGRDVGVFNASLDVHAEIEEGVAFLHLSGTIEFDVKTAMPIHVHLRGPAQTAYHYEGRKNGGSGKAKLEGTLAPGGRC